MVSQVFYYNQAQQYPQIQKDYQDVKQHVEKVDSTDQSLVYALEALPPVRRVASLPDKIQNGDYVPAIGLAGLAFMNLPEDWRDIKAAGRQIRSKIDPKYTYDPLYNRNTHQHSFSFFRGTAVEEWLHKKIDKGSKIAEKLYEMDDTLYDTKFGEKVRKFFGVEMTDCKEVSQIKDYRGTEALTFEFKSAKFGGEITARAMKRLPLLSVIAVGLLEIPKIFKAMGKGDDIEEQAGSTIKQTAKSAVNATSTLAGIGYGGAIGAKYGGAAGSLIGMGAGAILGATASKKLQEIIA